MVEMDFRLSIRDIICLTETHEHDGCKTPMFDGYLKLAVWNEAADNGKGYGGIVVLVKERYCLIFSTRRSSFSGIFQC